MKPASSTPDPEQFERLQQLLALKRHETPPPGYFDRFPDQVRHRITQVEAAPEPWWQQWLGVLRFNPALSATYAVLACALVLGGLWLATQPGSKGNPRLAASPDLVTETNQLGALAESNSPPPGLFKTPSLPVQAAEFKK